MHSGVTLRLVNLAGCADRDPILALVVLDRFIFVSNIAREYQKR
jgi:hypothetical protein